MRTKWAWAAVAAAAGVMVASFTWLHLIHREPAALGAGAYKVHYAFGLELAGPQGARTPVSAAIDGTLDLVHRGNGEMLARLRVGSLSLDDGARRVGFLQDGAEEALTRPFAFSVAPDGRVTGVRLAPELPLAVRSVLATVVNGSQYVVAVKPDADAWNTSETDHNGEYRAAYRYLSRREVEKTFSLGQEDSLGSVHGRAVARFTLDGPRVAAVTLEQKGDALTGASGGPRSRFTLALSLTRTGEPDRSWVDAAGEPAGELFTTRTSLPKNLRAARLTPRPKDEILGALAAAPKEETLTEHNALRNELTEAVVRDPAVADAVEKLLRLPEAGLTQRRLAVEALLGARTKDADARAARLIGDREVSPTVRIMFLGGATLLDNPGAPVVEAVRTLMKSGESPIYGQAAMAIGGIASRLADSTAAGEPDAASAAKTGRQTGIRGDAADALGRDAPARDTGATVTPISKREATANTVQIPRPPATGTPDPQPDPGAGGETEPKPTEAEVLAQDLLGMATHVLNPEPNAPRVPFGVKVSFLRALGNLGTEACLPLVRIGLTDENLLVRAAAVNALRFQDPATVKQDIAKAMRDPAMEVRTSAIKAARKMGPAATLDLVQTALFFDKSEYVRLQAVYTYGAWSHEAPGLLNKLTEAAVQEKSAKVQQAIRAMTQKNRVEPPFVMESLPQDVQ